MSEPKKEEEKEDCFNNKKDEDIEKEINILNQQGKEEINFESINFNINPFKKEKSEPQHKNIIKNKDILVKDKEIENQNIKYNNFPTTNKYESSKINPQQINKIQEQNNINYCIGHNILNNIEISNKNINNNNKKIYPITTPLTKKSDNNNEFKLLNNNNIEPKLNYSKLYNKKNKNTNGFTQNPDYSERVNYNPFVINNNTSQINYINNNINNNNNQINYIYNNANACNNQINYIDDSVNNNSIHFNYNKNYNNIIMRDLPSWICPLCNNCNDAGKINLLIYYYIINI